MWCFLGPTYDLSSIVSTTTAEDGEGRGSRGIAAAAAAATRAVELLEPDLFPTAELLECTTLDNVMRFAMGGEGGTRHGVPLDPIQSIAGKPCVFLRGQRRNAATRGRFFSSYAVWTVCRGAIYRVRSVMYA